jgi:hypothetical protein
MSVQFPTYYGSTTTIDLRQLEYAMYSESISPAQYDYRDPKSGLSFQKISKSYLFIADPAYPINTQLLTDQWQILYNPNFTGFGNVMFVAQGQDATVQANQKSINDVLATYFYDGELPIISFEDVYMKVVLLADPVYTVGTFFYPSQPYIRLIYQTGGSAISIPAASTIRIPWNNIADQVAPDVADNGQIIPVLTGNNTGMIQLSVAGRYIIEAAFDLIENSTALTTAILGHAILKLNGTIIKQTSSALTKSSTAIDGNVSIVAIVRVKDTDLTNTTYPNKAVLEIFGQHENTNAMQVIPTTFTECSISFLG